MIYFPPSSSYFFACQTHTHKQCIREGIRAKFASIAMKNEKTTMINWFTGTEKKKENHKTEMKMHNGFINNVADYQINYTVRYNRKM